MKKLGSPPTSCDWKGAAQGPKAGPAARPRGRVMRYEEDGAWQGVAAERYKSPDGSWASVIRRTLVGGLKGERTKFHLRYFEIAPGGRTSLELHSHEHVVVVVRGKGICRIRTTRHEIGPMDVAYIPPGAPHQLSNPNNEPFGFFCIVDAERDRPAPAGARGRKP